MTKEFRLGLSRLLLMPVLATGLVCSAPAHAADKTEPAAYDQSDTTSDHNPSEYQHVEGHIAFLHAELNITPDQEQLWGAVASAMREDVKDMQDAERHIAHQAGGRETAVQYLQHRVMFANLRAQGETRFLAAMQPLYESLSAQQKRTADDLLVATSPAGE